MEKRETDEDFLVGFACGHVQHLECLVTANAARADDAEMESARRLYAQLKASASSDASTGMVTGRGGDGVDGVAGIGVGSVGAKVAHAHIVGSFVKAAGCFACVRRSETEARS